VLKKLVENELSVYLLAVTVFVVLLANVFFKYPGLEEDVSGYPDMSFQQILNEYKVLETEVSKPLQNGKEFFSTAVKISNIRKAVRKFENSHRDLWDPRIVHADFLGEPLRSLDNANTARVREYKRQDFDSARKQFEESVGLRGTLLEYKPISEEEWRRFFQSLAFFQLGFMPIVFLVYAIRIEWEGGSVLLEMFGNPLFPLWLIFWEVGIFRYRACEFKKQMKFTLRYASFALSTALSIGSVSLKAQEKKREEHEGGGNNPRTLVFSGSTHYLPKYLGLNGAGFHPDPVWQSTLTVDHPKSGWYLNFWKSINVGRSAADPNFGREEDYTVGKVFKWGDRRTIDVAATYFNVTPLGVLPKGDLLQSSLNIGNLIPHDKFGTYLWIRDVRPIKGGKPPGGQFVHFGVVRDYSLKRITASFGSEAVFDSGAFGFKRAGIIRSSASLKILLTKGLTLEMPAVRMSVPFTNPNDGRKFEQVVGFGFSFTH
jgi:hypothetical protein